MQTLFRYAGYYVMGEKYFDEASDKEVRMFLYTNPCFEPIARHHVPEPAEHVDWESVPIFAPSVLETVI